jgi:predicted transcriptional regulator
MTIELARMTAEIVAAHLTTTPMPPSEVPQFMLTVRDQLVRISDEAPATDAVPRTVPSEALEDGLLDERWPGVYKDRIVCLEDGKPVKLLRSYLTKRYRMTADDYRRRWRLPADYPFTPPEYVTLKRDAAMVSGLGTRVRASRERRVA